MRQGRLPSRLVIMVMLILFSVISYYLKTQTNPVTGEKQRVALSPEQEVALGLQSAPEMAAQFGGLYQDEDIQQKIREIGNRLVQRTHAAQSPYQFNFYVLNDQNTINAFALPGGQIFITMAMLAKLHSDDEIAAVLGHEMAHVIHRHSSEQMAQRGLLDGIVQSVAVGSGNMNSAQIATYVGQIMNMKYSRQDELESDNYGVKYAHAAGYDARAALAVMKVLEDASGGSLRNEFMSTHPSPANRVEEIKKELKLLGY